MKKLAAILALLLLVAPAWADPTSDLLQAKTAAARAVCTQVVGVALDDTVWVVPPDAPCLAAAQAASKAITVPPPPVVVPPPVSCQSVNPATMQVTNGQVTHC